MAQIGGYRRPLLAPYADWLREKALSTIAGMLYRLDQSRKESR